MRSRHSTRQSPAGVRPLALCANTMVSALGSGMEATLEALREHRSGLRPCDFGSADLDTWIGRADDALLAPIEGEMGYFDCRNNRLARLALDCNEFRARVAAARLRFGAGRIALLLGTSTSGILSTEEAFRHVDPRNGGAARALQLHGHSRHELAGGLRRPRAGSRRPDHGLFHRLFLQCQGVCLR